MGWQRNRVFWAWAGAALGVAFVGTFAFCLWTTALKPEPRPLPQASTLEELEAEEPGLIATVLGELDLSRPGLEGVRALAAKGDAVGAGKALLLYYSGPAVKRYPGLAALHFRWEPVSQKAHAEAALSGTFTIQGATGTPARTAMGGIDWEGYGPRKDPEWAWMLNRHMWFQDYLGAWSATGDGRYAAGFDRQVTDWIASHPTPPGNGDNSHDLPAWRSLEIGRRLLETWPAAFYGFAAAPEFRPATRMRMLASIAVQADTCLLHPTPKGNHLNTECLGLAAAAAYWPEFKDAPAWLDAAVGRMRGEYAKRVYPDGAQAELSNHYQIDVATAYQKVAAFLAMSGHSAAPEFEGYSEKLWTYVRLVMRPDGFGPLNNDGEFEANLSQIETVQLWTRLLGDKAALAGGLSNVSMNPAGLESVWMPWAGTAVLRGSPARGRNADWLFFDAGPLGTAHEHQDTLHLALYSEGRDLLVDPGRYTYKPGRWRRYFTGQRGHNVVQIGGGQGEVEDPPRLARKPSDAVYVHEAAYDFVSGAATMRIGEGSATGYGLPDRARLRRSVLYVRDAYALVVDEVFFDGAHRIAVPWHFHPDCTLSLRGDVAETIDPGVGNLRIIPVPIDEQEPLVWRPRLVRGAASPLVEGWWSPHYNVKVPATTVLYETVSPDVATPAAPRRFAWLLVPGKGTPPDYRVAAIVRGRVGKDGRDEGDVVLVVRPDGKRDRLALPRNGAAPTVELAK